MGSHDTFMNVLFVSSEVFPLAKTGGLADVAGSLPQAVAAEGLDVRILLPAYPSAVEYLQRTRSVDSANFQDPLLYDARLIEGVLPGSELRVLLLDIPRLFQREGGPYADVQNREWPDNALRFACLSRAACDLAMDRAGIQWRADLVHCNDWQTGLIPAWLSLESSRPATVFTIHNQAYQGLFDRAIFDELALPDSWWGPEALEYYGSFSFLKAGLVFADKITTVSPTYARELLSSEFGCGLEGVLAQRIDDLCGILNGVDRKVWDPATDQHLPERYSSSSIEAGKRANKAALQRQLNLPVKAHTPLVSLVGRLVYQKGIDLVIDLIEYHSDADIQWAILGTGEADYEQALQRLAARYPDRISVQITYDEGLAHRIEAAADMFLMPSRFEPCGLNQMYSLLYGTVPVVRNTGGLADTVVDPEADPQRANGFVFTRAEVTALRAVFERALDAYSRPQDWAVLRARGMTGNFSWQRSAEHYVKIYWDALETLSASRPLIE